MSDLDERIAEALSEEDREILSQYDEEGLFDQLRGLFSGKMGWMAAIMIVVGIIVTFVGIYAAWKFLTVDDTTAMIRWGGLAWSLFTTQIMLKLWSWMRMGDNRVIREIKRLELQIARTQFDK